MKRILLIAALLLTTLSAAAQNGKSIYQKYAGAKNVSAVYVSPTMFRLIGKIPDLQTEGGNMDLTPIIQSLTGLYLINSENTEINANLQADVKKFVASGRYELLLEANDSGEIVRMYSLGDEKVVNSFVMVAVEDSETTFVCIDGQMDRDRLEKILSEQMKR